jgi:hypothetical protein
VLSRLCWDMVRQRHGPEEQHYVLHVPTPDITQADYLAVEPRLLAELRRARLATGSTVHDGLPSVMRLLARPPVELHGWIGYHDGTSIGVVAARDGAAHAVLATLGAETIRLRPITPDHLPDEVAGLLPARPAARAPSITVPVDAYRALVAGEAGGWLRPNSPEDRLDEELLALRRLLDQPRLGGGRFYAAARDRLGRRFTSPHPITYLDLESGRWLVRQKPSDIGDLWAVAIPAAPDTLVEALGELLRSLLSSMPR